ncbi:MAG: tetratricopeptide repeat protein [Polyangiaceae bacterium]
MAEPNDDANRQSSTDEDAEAAAPSSAPEVQAKSADPQVIKDKNRRIREEAAAKRRQKRATEEKRRVAPARNLDTSELVDDAVARTTHAVGGFLKQHFNVVQWIVLSVVVGGIGYQIYSYRHSRSVARATDELERGFRAEHGRVGDSADPGPDQYTGLSDNRPSFANDEARLRSAETEYRKVVSEGSSTTSALASLGLAGILLDQGKFKDAQAAYEKVKTSPLAKLDADARGRAIEGVGLSQEAAGQADAALASFRELENADIPGFTALGQYHQARLLLQKGQRAEAKAQLEKALKLLSPPKSEDGKAPAAPSAGGGFLEHQAKELMSIVDPSAAPRTTGAGMDPDQMARLQQLAGPDGKLDQQKLQELLSKMSKQGGGGPVPMPAPPEEPAPAPEAPVPSPAPAGSAP